MLVLLICTRVRWQPLLKKPPRKCRSVEDASRTPYNVQKPFVQYKVNVQHQVGSSPIPGPGRNRVDIGMKILVSRVVCHDVGDMIPSTLLPGCEALQQKS